MQTQQILLTNQEQIFDFYVSSTGMEPGVLQLSAGTIDLNVHSVDLDGVALVWAGSKGRSRWQDIAPSDGSLMIGFALESEGPILCQGEPIDKDHGLVWLAGHEIDYVFHGRNRTLEIVVTSDICDELGWQPGGEPLTRAPKKHLQRLHDTAVRATAAAATNSARNPIAQAEFWRNLLADALEPVLEPWLGLPPRGKVFSGTRNYHLVKLAEAMLADWDHFTKFEVERLASELGVHRRTLFYAFREVLGIGPRRYFELKRLNAFRHALLNAEPETSTVSNTALNFGFSEFGRLATTYRSHFGERPSQTLNRST